MRFGVREICDVTFKALDTMKIGNKTFVKGQPVLFMDTAKTSSMEGAATSVYANGGRGNSRLLAWEGEKTVTFTVEDALLSPISFAMLSGAGVVEGAGKTKVHVHRTAYATVKDLSTTVLTGEKTASETALGIDLKDAIKTNETLCLTAPIFCCKVAADGSLSGEMFNQVSEYPTKGDGGEAKVGGETAVAQTTKLKIGSSTVGDRVFVDFYIVRNSNTVTELQIDAAHFGGYFYVEGSTLFRRQDTGKDMPAEITFPKVKIQSNFTFSMASTGDPSTFTFTMDAFPAPTFFNPDKEVLVAMEIIDDSISDENWESVFLCDGKDASLADLADSVPGKKE